MRLLFVKGYKVPLVVAGPSDLFARFDPKADIALERDIDHCTLDPGGMLCLTTPYFTTQVDGFEFGIKADQIEKMLELWNLAEIREGMVEVPMWMRSLLIPTETYNKLLVFLNESHKSDIAMHAELTRDDLLNKLVDAGVLLRNPGQLP